MSFSSHQKPVTRNQSRETSHPPPLSVISFMLLGVKFSLWVYLMLGGAVGAACRQGVVLLLAPLAGRTGFPVAVLCINVLDSFLLGVTLALAGRGVWPEAVRVAFGTGVLGAFTTFSTFSAEMDYLMREGRGGMALLYALSSVSLGVLAAIGGRVLGGRL